RQVSSKAIPERSPSRHAVRARWAVARDVTIRNGSRGSGTAEVMTSAPSSERLRTVQSAVKLLAGKASLPPSRTRCRTLRRLSPSAGTRLRTTLSSAGGRSDLTEATPPNVPTRDRRVASLQQLCRRLPPVAASVRVGVRRRALLHVRHHRLDLVRRADQ